MILTTVWIIVKSWPKAEFTIDSNNIRISYKSSGLFTPADFSFSIADISSFSRKAISNVTYFELRLRIYNKVLHLTPQNYSLDYLNEFYNFFLNLEEKINGTEKSNFIPDTDSDSE